MPHLYNKQTGSLLGTLDESDLRVLIDELEEEDQTDDDYYIDGPTIDLLEEHGASKSLIAMLRAAVASSSEGIDIRWEKPSPP